MPDSAAGKRARCRKCGRLFRVPLIPIASVPAEPVPRCQSSNQQSTPPTAEAVPADEGLLALAPLQDGEPVAEPRQAGDQLSVLPPDAPPSPRPTNIQGIEASQRPFWSDLALSFVLCAKAGNWAMLFGLVLLSLVLSIPLPLLSCGMGLIKLGMAAYFAAIYMSTVLEAASGEDNLPGVWIHNYWDDLFHPALQFVGTWLLALSPALIIMIVAFLYGLPDLWTAVQVFAIIGAILWPVTVMCVAIGGTLKLSPMVIVRTALAAPLPYAAICIAVLVAAALTYLPQTSQFEQFLASLKLNSGIGGFLFAVLINKTLNIYAALVAMRVIGLYYRHFKDRFPWTAE